MKLSQKTEAAIASAEMAVIVRETADLQSVVNHAIAPDISVICGDPEERLADGAICSRPTGHRENSSESGGS